MSDIESDIRIPPDYICPITQDIMEDPVVAADGHTYERLAIARWFETGHRQSPMTNERLNHTGLIPNHRLKAIIQEFKENLPNMMRENQIRTDLEVAIRLKEEMLEEMLANKSNNRRRDVELLSEAQMENIFLKQQMEKMQRKIVQMKEQMKAMRQQPQRPIIPAARAAMQSATAEPPIAPPAAVAQAAPQPQAQAIATTPEQQALSQQLLTLVISGDQPAAEALLSQNPNQNLASIPGTVKDHANRTFEGTALQCAVASLDWFMWEMLLEKDKIPKQLAAYQLKEIKNHPYAKAILTNWQQMLQDYDTYIKNYNSWDYDKCEDFWVHSIGKCQHDSPYHVFQEFCNPGRPFAPPTPDFKDKYALERQLPEWAVISKVGTVFSFWRADSAGLVCGAVAGPWMDGRWGRRS